MLADVPTVWLWLMAAAATVIHCTTMAHWSPDRATRIVWPPIIIACGIGMVVVGKMNGHSLATTVVGYTFTIIGLTVGLFPMRKIIKQSTLDQERGVHKDYKPARGYVIFCIACVLIGISAAYVLTVPSFP